MVKRSGGESSDGEKFRRGETFGGLKRPRDDSSEVQTSGGESTWVKRPEGESI